MLTPNMEKALDIVAKNGAVFGGWNIVRGSKIKVSARTLAALERRGLLTVSLGPDGGMMGRLVGEKRIG